MSRCYGFLEDNHATRFIKASTSFMPSEKLRARTGGFPMTLTRKYISPRQISLGLGVVAASGFAAHVSYAQTHPDAMRYEYLYMNGTFVAPHKSFPTGRERSLWKCYDAKTNTTFECTFVRGGFDQFQFIFRAR
jgi:hypothetical protein